MFPYPALCSSCFAFSFSYNLSSLCVEQDGIFSPETDSGFNGTESRHPTPTGLPSLLHQGAIERCDCLLCLVKTTPSTIHVHLLLQQTDLCLYFEYFFNICHSSSVVHNRDSKNPDSGLITSSPPYSLLPSCCPATELRATSKFNSKQPRRTKPRKGQKRRTFTCSHQSWLKKSESEMSDVEPSSEFLLLTYLNLSKRQFFVIVLLHWCCILPSFFVFRFLCV